MLLRPPTMFDLDEVVAQCAAFYPPERPFVLMSAWHLPDLSSHGLSLMGYPPFMVRPAGGEAPPIPDGLRIDEVTDGAAAATFVRTIVEAYPMPGADEGTPFDERILGGIVRLFLGYVDDRPVATAGTGVYHGVNDVEWISLMPDCRGRGYGEAMTWAATLADPSLPAVLIASDDGQPVYERLGYLRLQRFTLWYRMLADRPRGWLAIRWYGGRVRFRRLARWSSLGVVVLVAVGCKPSTIFVGGSGCTGAELSIAADTLDIDGNVHSNGDISFDATGTIEGKVSGAGSIDLGAMSLAPATDNPRTTGVRAWPHLPTIADYRPGGEVASAAAAQGAYFDHTGEGEVVLSGTLASGVHYTDGDFVVTGSGRLGVTLVAERTVTIDDGGLFVPWDGDPDDITVFSNDDRGCDGDGIHITYDVCTPNDVHGTLVAPGSGILVEAVPDPSTGREVQGRLIAHHIRIEATSYNLIGGPPPTGKFEAVGCAVS